LSLLFELVKNKDIEAVKNELKFIKDINIVDADGKTALYYAVDYTGSFDMSMLLMNNGADPHKKNGLNKWSYLHSLAYSSCPENLKIIEYLMLNKNMNIDERSMSGETPFLFFCYRSNSYLLSDQEYRLIVDFYEKHNADIHAVNHKNMNGVALAFSVRNIEVVNYLLSKGVEARYGNNLLLNRLHSNPFLYENIVKLGVDLEIKTPIFGETVIFSAVNQIKSSESLKILLEHNINVNHQNNIGETPLMKSVWKKEFFEMLLKDSDLSLKDNKGRDIHYYIKDKKKLRIMTEEKALISEITNEINEMSPSL